MNIKTRSLECRQERSGGRFSKKCGCLVHVENPSILHSIISHKKVQRHNLEVLIKTKLFKRGKYLCQSCIDLYSCSDAAHNTVPIPLKTIRSATNEVEKQNVICNETSIESLSDQLRNLMVDDVKGLYKVGCIKDIKSLSGFSAVEWLKDRPSELVSFLSKFCNLDPDHPNEAFLLAQIIDDMYGTQNKKLVLPTSFQKNLLTYSLSHSRLLVDYLGTCHPGGSYTYVTDWLKQQAKSPISCPPGTVRIVFDNEQRVGKRYRVSAKSNTVPVSVVTSHAYLFMEDFCEIQRDNNCKPSEWLFDSSLEKNEIVERLDEYSLYFRKTRNQLLNDRLKFVRNEQKIVDNTYIDEVDLFVKKFKTIGQKICTDCGATASNAKCRLCPVCKGVLEKVSVDSFVSNPEHPKYDPYSHFDMENKESEVKVMVGEPDNLNPNSFTNILEILRNIAVRAGVHNYVDEEHVKRKWIFLENDGTIYRIVAKLIENVLHCSRCKESFYGLENFEDHSCFIVHDESYTREFDWIVQQPGLLHFEMNAGRAFVDLTWSVFMEDFAKALNFTSENALKFIKKGSDHHKLWDILTATYLALVDELLVPYVREALHNNENVSIEGYWNYCKNVKNPNYIFVQDVVLTYLHAMMLLRKGVRSGQSEAIHAAKSKLASIFFGRNHPIYQEILFNEFKIKSRAPIEIMNFIDKSLSTSRLEDNTGHFQSGDALLEEINKNAKRWVIGVPTYNQWERTFRNLDSLNEIRNTAFTAANMNESSKDSDKKNNLAEEISRLRTLIREKEYLLQPMLEEEHTSLDKEIKLNSDLSKFTSIAKENIFKYVDRQKDSNITIKPVFVTDEEREEREKIENQTISEIKKIVFTLMEQLDADEKKIANEYFKKHVKSKPKAHYIDFYYQVLESLESIEACDEPNCDE